jgi:aminoglycoside N3'-acetyltransferase
MHPVNSVIAAGKLAEALVKDVCLGSYSWDSPFDRIAYEDTVILCLGMTRNLSNSFSHYAETKANLPYLYNKALDYIPVSIKETPVIKDFYMTVRYLDYDIQPDRTRHDKAIRDSGLMTFADWGGGGLHSVKLPDYLEFLKKEFRTNPYFLLSKPPQFKKGTPPADGAIIREDNKV